MGNKNVLQIDSGKRMIEKARAVKATHYLGRYKSSPFPARRDQWQVDKIPRVDLNLECEMHRYSRICLSATQQETYFWEWHECCSS